VVHLVEKLLLIKIFTVQIFLRNCSKIVLEKTIIKPLMYKKRCYTNLTGISEYQFVSQMWWILVILLFEFFLEDATMTLPQVLLTNSGGMLTEGSAYPLFKNGSFTASYLFIFIREKQILHTKNCWLQRDSNSDCWSMRRAHWSFECPEAVPNFL